MNKINFCTYLTSQGKAAKRNGCGGIILYSWCHVLTAYRTYLPKIINVALNLPKLL